VIVPFRLGIANAFLVTGDRAILVDSARPGDGRALVGLLKQAGVEVADLALILHTHGHWDHAGSTRELKEWTQAPVAIHRADAEMLRRGDNGKLCGTCWTGRWLRPVLDRRYPGVKADVELDGEVDLTPYGVRARVLPTPGHTPGSVSVLTAEGEAIVGDLLMGGYFGGMFWPRRPTLHYYAEDMALVRASIRQLLAAGPTRVYVGHGGPLDPRAIARTFC
jgi:glyoxylase-like metal-dependent hydrolase (beta-lactamase superfamily II)